MPLGNRNDKVRRTEMKRYRIKKTALQSIIMFLLATLAHKENSDDAMLLFALIGLAMMLYSAGLNGNLVYRLARKIVRYGNLKGWYDIS